MGENKGSGSESLNWLLTAYRFFARLPYGRKYTLSDGSVAHLEKPPAPESCTDQGSHYYQRRTFGVDVMIEGGKLDHIENSVF